MSKQVKTKPNRIVSTYDCYWCGLSHDRGKCIDHNERVRREDSDRRNGGWDTSKKETPW